MERLLKDRLILLNGAITDDLAAKIVGQLLFLENEAPERDICIYVNSPGGSVTAALAIYETIEFVRPKIATVCFGQACGAAALLLAAGDPGLRYSRANARMMLTRTFGEAGQHIDYALQEKEIVRMNNRLCSLFAKHTGRDAAQIGRDMQEELFFSVQEAIDYGLIDSVYVRRTAR